MHRQAQTSLLLIPLLGILGTTASCTDDRSLLVHVSGELVGTASIKVLAVLNGNQPTTLAMEPVPVETIKTTVIRTFAVNLQHGMSVTGTIQVAVGLFDSAGCLIAAGAGDVIPLDLDHNGTAVNVTRFTTPVQSACSAELPIVAEISPNRAKTLSQAKVSLKGFGFLPGVQMSVQGITVNDITWRDPTEISAALPPLPGKAGPTPVAVTNPGSNQRLSRALLNLEVSRVLFAPNAPDDPQSNWCAPQKLATADLDGDGYPEILTIGGCTSPNAQLSIYHNLGNFTFSRHDVEILESQNSQAVGLVVAKLDQDDYYDVAVLTQGTLMATSKLFVYRGQAGGSLATPPERYDLNENLTANALSLGHILGTSDWDLVVSGTERNGPGYGALTFFLNQSAGVAKNTFAGPVYFQPYYENGLLNDLCRTGLSDLDRDGLPEIIAVGCGGYLHVFPNHGGQFGQAVTSAYSLKSTNCPLAAEDLNGDGLPDVTLGLTGLADNYGADIFFSHPKDLAGRMLPRDGETYPVVGASAPDNTPAGVTIGDINFDGAADVLVANRGYNATDPSVAILLNDGKGKFTDSSLLQFDYVQDPHQDHGINLKDIVLTDLNRDGLPDIIVVGDRFSGGKGLRILINQSQ